VLPGRPMWLGIHWTKMLKSLLIVDRCNQIDLQTKSDCCLFNWPLFLD